MGFGYSNFLRSPEETKLKNINKIGVLTSGGDCAGLNAAIRAITFRAINGFRWDVFGIKYGTQGLMERPINTNRLDLDLFTGDFLRRGGTILGSINRGDPFMISKFEKEIFKCEIKSILNESIITDLNSLNNHIDDNNFIKLLNEGYSKKTINSIFENLNKKEASRSIDNFYNVLSKKLTFDLKDKLLNSKTILVSGLSGVGKTTICAKIASYLLDQSTSSHNNDNITLVNLGKKSPNKTSNLFNFGRVLNLNVYSFSEIGNLDKYISENKNETIIVDISKDFLVDKNFNNYLKIIHTDNKKLLLNVIQSGINFKSLEKQMSYLDGLSPINVLTKLDEIIVNSYDFSMYHDLNCKLGLLSGTNNIIDSIAFANSLILAQYMKEN